MKIVMFNNRLHSINLPSKVDGSFALLESPISDEVLANIEAIENKWYLNTISNTKILLNNQLLDSVQLERDSFYVLSQDNTKKLIYVEDSFDSTFKKYKVSNGAQIIIGKNNRCQIRYKNSYIFDQHMALFYNNNTWNIRLANNANIYVNSDYVANSNVSIKNGDILFIYGLRIVLMNDVIMINNPSDKVYINCPAMKELTISQKHVEYDDVKEIDYYNRDDYFFKTPRLRRFIETYDLKFANPPNKQEQEEMPLILVLGPSLTMGIISIAMFLSVIISLANGSAKLSTVWVRIISCIAMLAGSLLWPNVLRRYRKKKLKEKEEIRKTKYRAYLEKKKKEMIAEGINQTQILKENLLPLNECYQIIINRKRTLWERKISQKDFLTVRLGTGDIPIDMNIEFNDSEFVIEEDELKSEASALVEQNRKLIKVPVGYSFYDKQATAIMGISDKFYPFISNIILQLVTFHSYDDLKIVIFTDKKNEVNWEMYKNLPHCFSNNKEMRFFATNADEMKNVSAFLENAFIERVTQKKNDEKQENASVENEDRDTSDTFSPYYLIFTDDFSNVRRLGIAELILKNKINAGFGFVIVEKSLGKLPSECVNFITLGNQTSGVLRNDLDDYYHQDFNDEIDYNIDMIKISEVLANIPIEFYEDIRFLPANLGFLEMQKVGKVEQLNSLNRWRLNDPTKSLRAAIGVNDLGNTLYLDLHEKYHGPHGLIAGMTGSGKSEFIITYILSMALNYSPNEVSFILIDYKGGGLAGAFENKTKKLRLPHLAGTITNLDKSELNRTLVSIDSELRKRQILFNEARDMLGESTIDIYKYQKFYRQRKVQKPIPHLFIICDEFAELKSQQPEFMDNLISTARIGRSLGVHLILATQKPSGVVNDQIWSNSKFRVCLKVQDRSDSNEMIKRPEAAEIKEAGRFYLQVGYNELFLYGQSGWAGTPYEPSDIINTKIDRSINYLDNIGQSIKDYDDIVQMQKVTDSGDELSNVLKYICTLARRENVASPRLWLDNIPENIYIESLINKYKFLPTKMKLEAIIGEYDDPSNQQQGLVKIDLGGNGNTIIYGTSGTNREMFLNALIYSICITHTAEEVNFYIFDFGSETMRIFKEMPQVGDIVYAGDEEKITKLHRMIDEDISTRKKLFADYNGEYDNYCRNSGKILPRKVYVFNNFDAYREAYPNNDDMLIKYAREGLRYGVILVIATASSVGLYGRFLRNFSNIYTLDMANRDNYINILGKIGNVYPANFDGRGIFKGELAYEYQTAKIYPSDKLFDYVKKKSLEIAAKCQTVAPKIPILPDQISLDMIKPEHMSLKNFPIGIYKDSLKNCLFNFETDKGCIVAATDIESTFPLVHNIILTSKNIENLDVMIIDYDSLLSEYAADVTIYLDKDIGEYFKENLESWKEKYANKDLLLISIGIEKFKATFDLAIFNNLIKTLKEMKHIQFITTDSVYKYQKMTFEAWYGELFVKANGMWVGNGVMDQNVIRITDLNKRYRINIDNSFIWLFKNASGQLVKIINDMGETDEE